MAQKTSKPRKSKEAEEEKPSKVSLFQRLSAQISYLRENERFRQLLGLSTVLFSLYMAISFTSFLFTWEVDQDKFIGTGWIGFLFSGEVQVENWLGKSGALIAHLFIHRWFGVASFLFVPVVFFTGFRIFLRKSPVSLKKLTGHSLFLMALLSASMAMVFNQRYFFIGGGFGFHLDQYMFGLIGKAGTALLWGFTGTAYVLSTFKISLWKKAEVLPAENDPGLQEVAPLQEQNESTDQTTQSLSLELDGLTEELTVEETKKPGEEITLETILPTEEEVYHSEPEAESESESEMEIEVANGANEEPDFVIEEAPVVAEIVPSGDPLEVFGPYDPKLELSEYQMPPVDLLEKYGSTKIQVNKEELEANKNKIVETLNHFSIKIDKIKAIIGPTVTLYEINPAAGIRISKIKNLEDDIALNLLALGIRIIAPIPGKGTIGIEVPNQKPDIVSMHSVVGSEAFDKSEFDLPIGIGKTISNEVFIADLAKMPHLLVAGATGQGKSVGLNAILVSLLYKKHPSQIKFVLVDPKKVELTLYRKIERHFLAKLPGEEEAIISDNTKVVHTMNSLCMEMDARYNLLKEAEVRNIKEYNAKFISRRLNPNKGHRFMPYIVVVVDEFADLIMTAGKEIEAPIGRLAQLARAIGIHLILATQRPSVNIITGTIKANFPARIAFRVSSKIDSRTILDAAGADQLIGKGDMLFSNGADLIRLQCAFIDTPELEKITEFIGSQRGYSSALLLPEYIDEKAEERGALDPSDRDSLFEEAARMVVQHQQGSASLLQRKLKLGYNRAGRLIDQLEVAGIIGKFEGSKAREVLVKDPLALETLLNTQEGESV